MKAAIKQIVKRFLLLCIPLLLGGNMVYAYPNGVTFEPAESDAETLQGQSDLKNVYEEALKVKKVGAELTFSNNKAYYIKNSRGDLATKDGSLVSTVKTDLGVTASQFAIIRYSGQYYLYSIADKKFICFHNSWISAGTYNIVLNNEDFDPVTITKTDRFTDYPFCINSYMSSNTYYLTTSSSTGNGAVFSRQTADDEEGYHYAIEEAGSFDPTEALTILNAKIPPTPYAVLSNNNTVLTFYYDDQKEDRGGMSVGPFSFESERDWYDQGNTITTVVFDASLANCSSLTSTAYWFYGFSRITTITGIENLKTDNVTDMGNMFYGCSGLTNLDVSSFKTDNVTRMGLMFYGCSSLTSLDLSRFKTDNVTSMPSMFSGCTSLTSLDLSNFKTNKVNNMAFMFANCSSLTNLDLNSFKTDNVTSMNDMFRGCSNMGTIYVGDGWTTTKVTWGDSMFDGCTQLVGGQGTAYNSSHTGYAYAHLDGGTSNPGYLSRVDTGVAPYAVLSDNNTVLTFYYDDQKEDRGGMSVGPFSYDSYPGWHNQRETLTTIVFDTSFANCSSLTSTAYWFNELSKLTAITGIENLKTDNVTEMFYMFNECFNLANLDVSNFKTDNVTDMSFMFRCCSGLTSLDVSNFKTDKVTHMNGMFDGCSSLTSLDVSGFKTDNVASMTFMFGDCSSLMSLDVSNFKTDNVTDMSGLGGMFFGCSGLTSLDVSNFKTDNVTDMSWMFYGCSSLTSLDVSNFKTAYVEDMRYMFFGCSSLTRLDVSNFKTDMVTHMNSMFEGCSELKTIYAGNGWSTKAVADGGGMFTGCTKLVGGAGTIYDANHTDATYAKIDGGTSNSGYFTGVNAIASFVTNGMAFKVTNQAAEKTVTYVQGPSVEHLIIPSSVTYDGQTYAVTAIADSAFAGQSQLKSVNIPSSVKAAGKNLFAGSPHVAAIIWEAPIKMTQEMVGTTVNNPNLLFYASDVSNAPDGVTNIINSQTKQAERIVLWDANENNDFYCPEEFTASSISYTHAYQLFTVSGQCQGWESLVLPFDVTEITHETKGIITPFGILQIGREFDNGTKPFWLYEYTTGGRFAEAEGIKANVPYILSMPNEAKLSDEYILAGNITFKGTNATVKKTSNAKIIKSGDYSFTPSYQNGTSASAYLLNVDQKYDGNPRGSVFVRNDLLERQARPFEAYFQLDGSAGVKSFFSIFDELTDGIRSMDPAKHNGNAEYYQLDGTKRSNLQRGFNIIRTKDNKVQKVFKK